MKTNANAIPVPPVPPPVRLNKRLARTALAKSRLSSRPARTSQVKRRGKKPTRTGPPARPSGGPARKELSAGGVVIRQDPTGWVVALLKTEHKRGQVWVLPKGHVELHSGERVSDAARREVQEEAGLTDLSVKNQLGITRFRFQAEGAVVYKTVHYFLMTTQQKTLKPQVEEGLLEAAWFPIEVAIAKLEYDTDQEIVRRAWERIDGARARRPDRRRLSRPRRTSRIHT
ncbi:MAG: NUDIX domain-containing protein [Candidatus Andersenbacteria bacterium]